ncbi:methyltransferase [Rhodobacteraceae bacterium WD3A24]|nr:methyltransferase [Rhodobacteraceae bacterium WD3A24]
MTEDRFLGGRLSVLQPRAGYRAATDPVFLAAAVPARAGQAVLDLGCGAGVASLCLAARVGGLARLAGVEIQPAYAALARENAARNGVSIEVFDGDVTRMPPELRTAQFDHVMANPPYFAHDTPPAGDGGRDTALRESAPVGAWVDAGLRRLRPGGHFTLIHRAERLPAILAALDGRAASAVLPLIARAGRDAGRIIVLARKGARAPFRLCAPLIVHAGAAHTGDHEDFTTAAQAVLRDGAALAV